MSGKILVVGLFSHENLEAPRSNERSSAHYQCHGERSVISSNLGSRVDGFTLHLPIHPANGAASRRNLACVLRDPFGAGSSEAEGLQSAVEMARRRLDRKRQGDPT